MGSCCSAKSNFHAAVKNEVKSKPTHETTTAADVEIDTGFEIQDFQEFEDICDVIMQKHKYVECLKKMRASNGLDVESVQLNYIGYPLVSKTVKNISKFGYSVYLQECVSLERFIELCCIHWAKEKRLDLKTTTLKQSIIFFFNNIKKIISEQEQKTCEYHMKIILELIRNHFEISKKNVGKFLKSFDLAALTIDEDFFLCAHNTLVQPVPTLDEFDRLFEICQKHLVQLSLENCNYLTIAIQTYCARLNQSGKTIEFFSDIIDIDTFEKCCSSSESVFINFQSHNFFCVEHTSESLKKLDLLIMHLKKYKLKRIEMGISLDVDDIYNTLLKIENNKLRKLALDSLPFHRHHIYVKAMGLSRKIRCTQINLSMERWNLDLLIGLEFSQAVSITFSAKQMSNIILAKLAQKLQNCQKLVNLALILNESKPDDISDYGMKKLANTLQNLKSLKSINLSFISDIKSNLRRLTDKNSIITNEFFQSLFQALDDVIENLTDFNLTFIGDNYQISELGFESSKESLEKMQNLASFKLVILEGSENYFTDLTIEIISSCLINCESLKHLCLHLKGKQTTITDEGLIVLSESIKNFSLFTLSLGFQNNCITDKGITVLGKTIQNFRGLKSLILLFHGGLNTIGDEGLKNICSGFSRHSFLEEIEIDLSFGQNYITQLGIKNFSAALSYCLQLKKLIFQLQGAKNEIADHGIKHLFQSLKKLESLSHLNVNFGFDTIGNAQISDVGVKYIGESLCEFKLLSNFQLNLSNSYGGGRNAISDVGMVQLAFGISKLKILQQINLDFSLRNVGDAGFHQIVDSFSKNNDLTVLKLNFSNTEIGGKNHLTEDSFRKIANFIKNTPTLTEVYFDLRFNQVNKIVCDKIIADLRIQCRDRCLLELNYQMSYFNMKASVTGKQTQNQQIYQSFQIVS